MSSDFADPTPAYAAPALDKGLDVLELLARDGAPLTQADIARALGRSASELFRIMATLERRGYLWRDPVSGAYRPTLRMLELGQAHRPEDVLLRAAAIPMQRLAAETREACHLSVLHRGSLLVLAQEEGTHRVRLSVAVGSTIDPLRSASGRMLLAILPPEERMATLAADPGWLALTREERAAALDRLDAIRARGHETAHAETVAGVSDLAAPVGSPATRTQAALAIAALPRHPEQWAEDTLPALKAAAADITAAAGLALPRAP
ncbi:MAG: IclR family transcriptional regulator [Thermomicrobiales bacterium]